MNKPKAIWNPPKIIAKKKHCPVCNSQRLESYEGVTKCKRCGYIHKWSINCKEVIK